MIAPKELSPSLALAAHSEIRDALQRVDNHAGHRDKHENDLEDVPDREANGAKRAGLRLVAPSSYFLAQK
jgi:hypothetical protein